MEKKPDGREARWKRNWIEEKSDGVICRRKKGWKTRGWRKAERRQVDIRQVDRRQREEKMDGRKDGRQAD